MARIVSLRAHLERITEEFVHGVLAVIADEAGARVTREAASRPVLRAVDSAPGDRASSSPSVDGAARKRGRPARVAEAAASRPSRVTDIATKAEAPNAVTDPELLLAALEQRSDAPVSGTHESPARRRVGRPSKKANGTPAILTPVVVAPPPPVAGPALRGDEVSLRTLRGGVVIKRVRRQEAV